MPMVLQIAKHKLSEQAARLQGDEGLTPGIGMLGADNISGSWCAWCCRVPNISSPSRLPRLQG